MLRTGQEHVKPFWSKLFNKSICNGKLAAALILGQILSLLICGTAITSGILGEKGVFIPTAQSFLNYLTLCLVYTTMLAFGRGEQGLLTVLKERGFKYFILAIIDVEANYLIVKAYHYTTVTSVQLLDCFTIPTVLFCSWCFLRVRYRWPHFLGVFVCLLGVGTLILADVLVDKYSDDASNKVLGDLLCLLGALLYGLSNVGQEYVVRSFNRIEFLGMIGLYGSVINGVQFAILERNEITAIDLTDYKIVISLLVFAACLFALYSLMPIVIGKTSATAVNLNLLSADFYALLVGLFLFHYKFHILYFVSFAVIILGLLIYSVRAPPVQPQDTDYTTVSVHIAAPTDTQVDQNESDSNSEQKNTDERTSLCASPAVVNYVEVRERPQYVGNINENTETLC